MSRQAGAGYGSGPGIDSEELVKELLQESGWAVKELRKAADGGAAPMLENQIDDSLRVVDFQVHCPEYRTHYVEVKSKERAAHFRKKDEYRHGWEEACHDDYREFERTYTDCPVYVFVHERETGVILRQRVRNLSVVQHLSDGSKLQAYDTTDPIVLFRRDEFDVVTDDVSQYSAGFGQTGLIENDIDLSPFGHDEDGEQGDLFEFGGGDDE